MKKPRLGDIGGGEKEYEFEPLTDPGIVTPAPAPAEPAKEPVPA